MSSQPDSSHRIVVGTDGSPASVQAVQSQARQADLTGATLEVLTTWEWPTSFGWALPFPADYDPAAEARKLVEGVISKVRAAHPGLRIRATVAEGHPAPVLVQASDGADLLVVGSRGAASSPGCSSGR